MGAKELAESDKHGFICIYGDTDGLLLIEKQDTFTNESFTMESAKARVKPLLDECYERFKLPIDNDRNFIEVTPIEKKQYFGIDAETKRVIVKGLEGKKSDACKFNRQQFKRLMYNYERGLDLIPDVRAGLEVLDKGELTAEDLAIKAKLSKDADEYPDSAAITKIARAYNGKKDDVVQYYLTGKKGNAYSPHFEDCNISKYKDEHLTDIGKVLYAMGYDVDALYGSDFEASKKLLRRREENDRKKKKAGTLSKILEKVPSLTPSIRIERTWSMPSPRPFQIPAIAQLIEEECAGVSAEKIVDLFPYQATKDAFELLKSLPDASVSVFLIDPPYSHSQLKDLYEKEKPPSFKMVSWESAKQYWVEFRKELARVLEPGGKCITLAWNSQGTGKGLGFEITRILQVAHGGNRNDTIVTVDRKIIVDASGGGGAEAAA